MDGFSVLSEDHRNVEHMLGQLVELMPNQSDQDRAQLAQRLVMEESKHEAAEEMYFWPLVRQRCDAGDRLADRAQEEESEAKSVLDKLRKADRQGQRFSTSVEVFAMLCRAHIGFEENQVWPNLRERLTASEAEDLGQKLQKAEKSGPTRPHLGVPSSPGALKTAGAAAAVVDRVRDTVTGRG